MYKRKFVLFGEVNGNNKTEYLPGIIKIGLL